MSRRPRRRRRDAPGGEKEKDNNWTQNRGAIKKSAAVRRPGGKEAARAVFVLGLFLGWRKRGGGGGLSRSRPRARHKKQARVESEGEQERGGGERVDGAHGVDRGGGGRRRRGYDAAKRTGLVDREREGVGGETPISRRLGRRSKRGIHGGVSAGGAAAALKKTRASLSPSRVERGPRRRARARHS